MSHTSRREPVLRDLRLGSGEIPEAVCVRVARDDVADEKLVEQLRAFDVAGFGGAEIETLAIGMTVNCTLSSAILQRRRGNHAGACAARTDIVTSDGRVRPEGGVRRPGGLSGYSVPRQPAGTSVSISN